MITLTYRKQTVTLTYGLTVGRYKGVWNTPNEERRASYVRQFMRDKGITESVVPVGYVFDKNGNVTFFYAFQFAISKQVISASDD